MNDEDRNAFAEIRRRHHHLEEEVSALGRQLSALERRLQEGPASVSDREIQPTTLDQLLDRKVRQDSFAAPPVISMVESAETARAVAELQKSAFSAAPPNVPSGSVPEEEPQSAASFEMRLGTYWLVRVGVVMLLTALVFFGNLAYQHWIRQFGPGGKITLLYLASFGLLGLGAWLERRSAREGLRNYSQVLFAGGLAAVFFTTYAAHHLPQLQVIGSALVDGGLLLAWTAFMVWIADRKRSEVMAMFAVGLAFYAAVITRVGSFTLYANLLLSGAGLFLLMRNRWAALSFGTLIGSYAAYGFWRFVGPDGQLWGSPADGLWAGAYFLFAYWLLFTASVFFSGDARGFVREQRATFLTMNNGALLVLFILTMLQVQEGGVWKFLLIYGSVLLVLAEMARRFLAPDPLAKQMYLTQGLVLTTLGVIFKFTGMQLALLLAAESVVLLVLGQLRQSTILRVGSYITAGLGVACGLDALLPERSVGLYTGLSLAGLLLANAVVCARLGEDAEEFSVRPPVTYFSALGLLILLVVTWLHAAPENLPLWLTAEALVILFGFLWLGLREPAVLGQGFLVMAHFAAVLHYSDSTGSWRPLAVLLTTFGLGYWWRYSAGIIAWDRPEIDRAGVWAMRGYWSLGTLAALYWVRVYVPLPETIAAYGLLGLALFIGAGMRRDAEFLPFSAAFTGAALLFTMAGALDGDGIRWMHVLAPLLLLAEERVARTRRERYVVDPTVMSVAIVAGGLVLWWVLTRWILQSASGFYLTASWSVFALALFATGVLVRERLYRWLGLGVLGCAVARVVLFDVWKLDTGFRVLSFFALGVVLMALGFIYNRYQEKIRQWL